MIQRYGLAFSALFCLFLSSSLFSQKLTPEQKTELRQYRTISVLDQDGQVKGYFEVKFMPGSKNVKKFTKEAWKSAKNFFGYIFNQDGYLTENVFGQFVSGVETARDYTVDYGLGKVCHDFKCFREDNARAKGFGKNIQKTLNLLKFVGKVPVRAGVSAFGLAYGALWGTVVPAFYLVAPVVAAPVTAVFGAGVAPLAMITWNAGAWFAVKGSDMPESESTPGFMVRYRDGAPKR